MFESPRRELSVTYWRQVIEIIHEIRIPHGNLKGQIETRNAPTTCDGADGLVGGLEDRLTLAGGVRGRRKGIEHHGRLEPAAEGNG